MKTAVNMAALLLGAVVFVGCDNKENSASTTPPATPTVTTPATPDTTATPTTPMSTDVSKATSAVDSAVDKGSSAVKTEADKLMNNAPTTMPSMPAMPK